MNDEATLLDLSQQLLSSIIAGDWQTYEKLCDPSLSCFEPEAMGNLVEGMDFHRYYFPLELPKVQDRKVQATIVRPQVRIMGECAIVCYIRLMQSINASGGHQTSAWEETRVWQKQGADWRHVHFHRSPAAK